MRLSSTFVFLGLVAASALAYPFNSESSSIYARENAYDDLADLAARWNDDAVDLEARHHFHFGSGDGPSVSVHLRSDDFDELDARDYGYDDAVDLVARHHIHLGSGEGPSVTVHLRSLDNEYEDLLARYDNLLDELDAREDYEELEARHFHPRIGVVIPSSD